MPGDELIEQLDLEPHPEGGHYRETWRATGPGRPAGTAIYFLLRRGEQSHWHRIDSAEIWHHYQGDGLELSIENGGSITRHRLDTDNPQVVVAPGAWQAARPLGSYALVGCTVSPGFDFEHFELAPEGWSPGQAPASPTGLNG